MVECDTGEDGGRVMGDIKMSYIFLEKEKHEKKMMKEIILDVIDQVRIF